MFLKRLELTTALRPVWLSDESLLFVQDAVGLYEGKFKIPNFQNGQAYLTSHRVCYVDHEKPRECSAAIDLKEVERYEFHAGFLRSSPKVVFFPKSQKRSSSYLASSPALQPSSPRNAAFGHASLQIGIPSTKDTTWICPICSFSNPVPSNFDPSTANTNTPLPPCLACGVTPPLGHVLKAAIAQTSSRETYGPSPVTQQQPGAINHDDSAKRSKGDESIASTESGLPCPRCTFLNHPSLLACEICGARLPSSPMPNDNISAFEDFRSDSPGPSLAHAAFSSTEMPESIKFSFRAGGDKTFYERLKGAMIQRKWLLHGAPPVPKPEQGSAGVPYKQARGGPALIRGNLDGKLDRTKSAGLAGLEQRDLITRKNNEIVIGKAFEDLEALMASAKEIVALAETFAGTVNAQSAGNSSEARALISQSATALGLATTKDLLGSGGNSESLYISELSRNLAEFLTDDSTGILRREGGIMSLVDLWSVFNRARGGVELVSPLDFHKAASMWEKLNLSIRLRKFKSGLLVVQHKDRSDERTVSSLLNWLGELRDLPSPDNAQWDYRRFGKGVTPQETAERFGWSVGVASEELQMAEERGALCREEGIEGVRFWENWFLKDAGLSLMEVDHGTVT